jgi:SAM-dependent methyltransferase
MILKMKKTIQIRSKLFIQACEDLVRQDDRALDVGCGNGIMAVFFKDNFNCDIMCTDILNYIQVKLPFIKMNDPCKLPFRNDEFDKVMLIDVLHHMDDSTQELILGESKRVGRSILIFETQPTLVAKILDHVLNYIHEKNMNIPLNFKNENYWQTLLVNMKFKSVKNLDVNKPLYYPLKHFGFICEK